MARYYRSFLAFPLTCIAILVSAAFYSPTATATAEYDHVVTITASYDNFDWLGALTATHAEADHAAILASGAHIDKPYDAHGRAYTIGNQPLATWRMAADVGFQRIDPHRLIG